MKKILLLSFLLISCAYGVSDSFDSKTETTVSVPKPTPRQPNLVNESSTEVKSCEIIQSVYADNCVLNVIKCPDGSTHFDSYCFGPPYVPEWVWWHDPVGPLNVRKNITSKESE